MRDRVAAEMPSSSQTALEFSSAFTLVCWHSLMLEPSVLRRLSLVVLARVALAALHDSQPFKARTKFFAHRYRVFWHLSSLPEQLSHLRCTGPASKQSCGSD